MVRLESEAIKVKRSSSSILTKLRKRPTVYPQSVTRMNGKNRFLVAVILLFAQSLASDAQPQSVGPLKRTLECQDVERDYFIALPKGFDPDRTYWPLVVVHGGGGNARGNPRAIEMRRMADEAGLPAILILPEFVTHDKPVSRFPVLGEGAYLEALLTEVRAEFKLHEKILLTGYSMGGQFSHRFALQNPEMVQACATFAAGTWSTPDGRLLVQGYGEVKNPKEFLLSKENAFKVTERLRDLFEPRTAEIAGLPAAEGADKVPFLVMCGTLDPRHNIAVEFADSLRDAGFTVETEWPKTPHGSSAPEYRAEFAKYPKHAIQFFRKHTP